MRQGFKLLSPSELKAPPEQFIVVQVDLWRKIEEHPIRHLVATCACEDDAIMVVHRHEDLEEECNVKYHIYDDSGAQRYPDD